MNLGILSIQFRHLTACIILAGSSSGNEGLRVAQARQAISLLPNMVPNWNQVYNPAVWELLYFPFTPLFVLFENIMRDPSAPTVHQDLELLATTKTYFSRMRTQLCVLAGVSSKLEHTAGVFLKFAEDHVTQHKSGSLARPKPQDGMMAELPLTIPDFVRQSGPFPGTEYNQQEATLGDLDMDTVLHWLPEDLYMRETTDISLEGEPDEAAPGQESRGMKRNFDNTFDWFSWDTYYASGTIL